MPNPQTYYKFSFKGTEKLSLFFLVIQNLRRQPWPLDYFDIFKFLSRTDACEFTRLARNISLGVMKKCRYSS
jgi:hypothetical protein